MILTGMDGAPLRYRAWNLLETLSGAGLEGEVLYHSDIAAVDACRSTDLLILYRAPLSAVVARAVREARSRGVPVVFSSDDLVFCSKELGGAPALDHPDPRIVAGYRESVEGHARCFQAADAFLGSTPELSDAARALGKNAYCLSNGLSRALLDVSAQASSERPLTPRDDGRCRLGFASGTDTHDADLAMIAPALAATLTRFPHVGLVLGGPLRLPSALESFTDRIERFPLVAWNELPEKLAALDVNLAPLDTARPFNLAKSAVKLLEAAAVGVATIASDAPAFARASRQGGLARLCRSQDDWKRSLADLISHCALRDSLGGAARREARETFSLAAGADDAVDVVEEILARGSQGQRDLPPTLPMEAGEGSEVSLEPAWQPQDQYQWDAERGGPLGPGAEVEQTFQCTRDGLRRVDVRVGTYARRNRHDVHLALRDEAGAVLARRRVPASHLVDGRFVALELDTPCADSAGRRLTLQASAPNATKGNEILLWHAPCERGGLRIGGREQHGRSLSFRSFTADRAKAVE